MQANDLAKSPLYKLGKLSLERKPSLLKRRLAAKNGSFSDFNVNEVCLKNVKCEVGVRL